MTHKSTIIIYKNWNLPELTSQFISSLYVEKSKIVKKQEHPENENFGMPEKPIFDDFPLKKAIITDAGESVLKFISEQIDLNRTSNTLLYLKGKFVFEENYSQNVRNVINLNPINHYNNINTYFRSVNTLLPDAGMYIGCYEDYAGRKKRILKNYPRLTHQGVWLFDFIINRVMPRLSFSKPVYKFLSRGKNNAISKAETLGRLCHAGFEIITNERINGLSYFSVMKVKEPKNDTNVSYGPIFKMKRISKGGKVIGVYKIRTMHPYSEYLQDYVVRMNGYCTTGKPKDDFRVTGWSKIIRKLHLDEIPQLLNVLKGDLNIMGVRPLSKFGYESLPLDLQRERIKYKPGCIPPNISLGLKGFYGVIWAERLYLRRMKKKPFLTNLKFFFMAVFNLVRRKSESA